MPTLYLMCGLPGAGKSTLARQMAQAFRAVVLSPDEWLMRLEVDVFDEPFRARLEGRFWNLAQELLGLGQSVILDFGFWARAEREEKRLAARALGVAVELHYLSAPLDELWRRVESRGEASPPGTVRLSRHTLEGYTTRFEPPTAEELAAYDPPRR